jgi:hypothetical protein
LGRSLRDSVLLLLGLAAPLRAQLAPVGVPKGTLRFDIGGRFESADRRLFDGQGEGYLADYGSPALGSDKFAFLKATDSVIGNVLGQSTYKVNLGALQADGQRTVGTGIIGIALGITRRLTLFTRIPLVTTRIQARLREDSSSADAGFNPAHPALGLAADQAKANQFFSDFTAALSNLDARIAGGSYAGNPALEALARDISARAAAIRDGLLGITTDANTASPFLPTTTSATGQALIARIRGLQDTLATTLGVSSNFINQDPVLAGPRLSDGDVTRLLSNTAGPINALPFGESKVSRIGDMDVGAIYTLVDRFDRPGTRGGFRLAAEALLRLPTGQRDNPDNLLHAGTGNGRYELGVSGTADFGRGAIGARVTGGYLKRFTALRVQRVSAPDQPFAEANRLTNVRLRAGDVVQLGAQPFLRLARNIVLHGSADYWREASGHAEYYRAIDAIAGISASVLVAQSRRSALALGGGISYVGRAARECEPERRCGFPIDASWTYTSVVRASAGRVPQYRTTRLEIRWYQRLWR